jgi:hypothetical protein
MPVYTLNPSHKRNGSHKASRSPSLRERMTLRRNSASSADGSETYYPTSSTSSSSTQRSRAASSGDRVAANAQARRYSAEASGVIGNPRKSAPTGMYVVVSIHKGTDWAVKDATRADIKAGWAMTYEDAMQQARRSAREDGARFYDMSSHPGTKRNPLSEDGAVVSNPRSKTFYNVYLGTEHIGAVSRSGEPSAEEVRRSLIEREGYDPDIRVVKGAKPYPRLVRPIDPGEDEYYAQRYENPRRKGAAKRSGGRTAAQGNAAKAMKLYHSGQASSLAEAWQMVRGSSARRNPLSEDGAVVSNPRRKSGAKRAGKRTAAQSNAAKAMKLYHSGQASSLAEAWSMIRGGL